MVHRAKRTRRRRRPVPAGGPGCGPALVDNCYDEPVAEEGEAPFRRRE